MSTRRRDKSAKINDVLKSQISCAGKDETLYVINKNMLEMMGYTYEEFVDAFDGMVANSICDEDVERVSREVFAKMEDGNEYTIEYRVKKKDGGYIWVHDVGRKIVAEDGRNAIISVLVDVSKDVRMRTQLQEEIAKDFLTGVNNRKGGEILVREKMKLEEPYIFFMLDLDNFKKVNDFFGHEEGDKMLRITADLLVNTFRQTDVVIRMGGDEFAVGEAERKREVYDPLCGGDIL